MVQLCNRTLCGHQNNTAALCVHAACSLGAKVCGMDAFSFFKETPFFVVVAVTNNQPTNSWC